MPGTQMVVSDVEVILRALSLHAAFTAPLKGGTQADAETYLSLFRSFSGGGGGVKAPG